MENLLNMIKKKYSEKTIEKKLREAVKQKGGLALKFYSPSFTGLPDRIVLLPGGCVLFAEVKTTGKKPTPRQTVIHIVLRKLGFTVAVVDDEVSLTEFLKQCDAKRI